MTDRAAPGAPRYLFHWTTPPALDALAACIGRTGLPLSRPIPRASVMYRCYPQLRGRPALYAWIHPITAMAAGESLIYAGRRPRDARLLALKIKPRSAVVRLRTPSTCPRHLELKALDKTALIDNEILYPDGGSVREWIILDGAAVETASADPEIFRAFFGQELEKLHDVAHDYAFRLFHIRSATLNRKGRDFVISLTSWPRLRRNIVLPRLEAMSKLRASAIPAPLRRRLPIERSFWRAWGAVRR